MEKFAHCSISDGIAVLVINRPEVHNALHPRLIAQVTEIMEELRDSKEARMIVLSSAGETFCAGADIQWMQETLTYSADENLRDAKALARMFRAIRESPKPVIARIQGSAFGGGIGLVAASDFAVAVSSAKFCFSEVKLGIIPAVIAPFVLSKIGAGAFRRYALTAEPFSASDARKISLLSEVFHSVEELDQFIAEISRTFKKNGPRALAACKKLIHDLEQKTWDDLELLTAKRIAEIRVSPEGQEGLRAFLEKRKPSWVP